MSLDWNIGKCVDFVELKSDEQWPITQYLIFACMGVGLSGITEKNITEFYARLKMVEALRGARLLLVGGGKDPEEYEITPADLRRRIGLTTNVSTESRPTFIKRHAQGFLRDAEYIYNREARAEARLAAERQGEVA